MASRLQYNYYMKLTLKQLKIILAYNEVQLKDQLLIGNLQRIIEILNHRVHIKDSIIEVLELKLSKQLNRGATQ